MQIRFESLLKIQRDLYRHPQGMDRFRHYLKTMIDPDTGDIRLPLPAMNPMGKEHVPALLDFYLSLDAEAEGARAADEAAAALAGEEGDYRAGLVVADDLKGGWTNRYFAEFGHRFEGIAMYKRNWIVALLWTSEAPSLAAVREATVTAVFRAAYVQAHGQARTLRDRLAQEGWVLARSGWDEPALTEEDLEYTRGVLAPLLESKDAGTAIECLFGDEASANLGLTRRGLGARAGLALALHDAKAAK
jgi:hypothetical protein